MVRARIGAKTKNRVEQAHRGAAPRMVAHVIHRGPPAEGHPQKVDARLAEPLERLLEPGRLVSRVTGDRAVRHGPARLTQEVDGDDRARRRESLEVGQPHGRRG